MLGWLRGTRARRRPSAYQLASFLRHIGYGLEAGVPLGQALRAAGAASGNSRLEALAASCADAILQGRPLHTAFEESRLFLQEHVHAIRVGEESAQLGTAMEVCAEAIERREELSRKIRGAVAYPAIVLLMACGAAYMFLTMVIPQVAGMFQQAGVALPLPTRLLLALSRALTAYWATGFGALLAAVGMWATVLPADARTRLVSAARSRLPFFGTMYRTAASARAARSFATLIGAGVPVLTALRICADGAPSPEIKDAWAAAADYLRRGARMSEALATSSLHPLLVQAIASAENSGNMQEAVHRAAASLEKEAMHMASTLQNVVEPVFTVGTGVILGGLLLAMYLPIVNVVNTIR
jgi:general secretion pathway protein F